jgi:hypothetical protein
MSSVSSAYPSPSRIQYISSMDFDRNIFQYSSYVDSSLRTRGRLIIHPSAVLGVNCKKGTILRENGKKLHGATHPDLVDPTTNLPYTYLVGVYDVVSGINGFINPSAPYFGILSTDKSYQDDLARYQIDASQNTPDPSLAVYPSSNVYPYDNTGKQILGPSVYTAGDVLSSGFVGGNQVHAVDLIHTLGFIVSGPNSLITDSITNLPIVLGQGTILANSNITSLANIYASNGVVHGSNLVALSNVTAGRNINASNGTITGSNLVALSNLTVNTGKLILNSACSGVVSMAVGQPNVSRPGGGNIYAYATVTTSQITANSIVIGSTNSQTSGQVSIEAVTPGTSFQLVANANYIGNIMWVLIN